ncbi:MAG: hypothetical protein WCJ41_01580 [Aestuariivirga sp.]|uniref:hypothetical protein n=1 Tax=Aestuariivirga sp. TaxID=2650926 RepID=UPI0030186CF0
MGRPWKAFASPAGATPWARFARGSTSGGYSTSRAPSALPIWAGVIPVRQQVLAPQDDPRLLPGLTPPKHITDFKFG